ncbi:MAG: type II toxin-antitoxin system RelB/DinJ family antitoxin [Bacteroidales bacterium]|nr:type II toxin-antitoxin system RelB/DinJ family antitoxin [Bacteroidales bacterium]
MPQVATTIRMDSEIKRQFDELCSELGMSLNTAVNIFAKKALRIRGLPFSVDLDSTPGISPYRKALDDLCAEAAKLPEMTPEEIDKLISDYRASKS